MKRPLDQAKVASAPADRRRAAALLGFALLLAGFTFGQLLLLISP